MLTKKRIVQIFADAYHEAALKNADMRSVTKSLETIRTALLSKQDLFNVWDTIDIQISNADADNLQETLVSLRDQYEQEVRTTTIERLQKIFKKNLETGWTHWLGTYAEALASWRVTFLSSLCEAQFPFPTHTEQIVEKIKRATQYILHERWPETYDLYIYLAEQKNLSEVIRAKMYVTAGEIQLYHFIKLNKAKELFSLAEQLAPKEGRVSCGWGEYWLQQNDIDQAKEYFQRTIDSAPLLADGYTKMGECYETQGNWDAAKEWYEEAVRTTGDGYLSLLRLYESPNLFRIDKESIPHHIKRAIALDPDNEYTIYETVGNIYKQNKQYKEAFRWYQKAILLDSNRISGYISQGLAYLEPGVEDYEKARKSFQKVIEVSPEAFDGYWGLTSLYEKQGEWEEAIKWYKKSLLYRPEWEGMIRAKIAEMKLRLEKYSEAEEELIEALKKDIDNEIALSILLELADDYFMIFDDAASAIRIYNEVREIKGESYEAESQNLIGNVYYYFGQNKEAIKAYRKAIAAKPRSATYHCNLGGAYRELGDLDKAKKAFEKAVELEPENDYYLNRLGKVLYYIGDYENAIDYHTKAIEKDPRVAVYHANLGLALRDLGKWDDAEKAYLKAVKLEPDNSDYHNGLGVVCYTKGDYEKSIDSYKKAIEIDPRVALYYANLGLAFQGC